MEHAALANANKDPKEYQGEAKALGLKLEPPLYTVANPFFLGQRMEKRLTKPLSEYQDDVLARKLNAQYENAKGAISTLQRYMDDSQARIDVMTALFDEIESHRENKEKALAIEKKVAALNPTRHSAGATPAGGRSSRFFPSENTHVFYAASSATPFDTFFCAAEGNKEDPRSLAKQEQYKRRRQVQHLYEWADACDTASHRLVKLAEIQINQVFFHLYKYEAPIQELWAQKLKEYSLQLNRMHKEYDDTVGNMNKLANTRDKLEGAWQAKQDPLRLAKRRLQYRGRRPKSERIKDMADAALNAEIESLHQVINEIEAKVTRTDEQLNALEAARRDLVDKIKIKENAKQIETESKTLSVRSVNPGKVAGDKTIALGHNTYPGGAHTANFSDELLSTNDADLLLPHEAA